MFLTGVMNIGCHILNNGAKVLFLGGRHPLQAMRQLHVDGGLGLTQRHILLCIIAREDTVTISDIESIKLRQLSNKVSGTVRRNSTVVDLIKTILYFATTFEKE